MPHRCFLAIRLPVIEDYFNRLEDYEQDGKIKRVDPDLYHFTLHFFGNISSEQIEELRHLELTYQKFNMSLGNTGVIPNLNRARVLYIDVIEGRNHAESIHTQLINQLVEKGYSSERKFLPHLTVARIKKGTSPRQIAERWLNERFEKIEVTVEEIVLVESLLTPNGPIYKDRWAIPLL